MLFLGLSGFEWFLELEFVIFGILAILSIPKNSKLRPSITKEKLVYIAVLAVAGTIAAVISIFLMRTYNDWFGALVAGIFSLFGVGMIRLSYRKVGRA